MKFGLAIAALIAVGGAEDLYKADPNGLTLRAAQERSLEHAPEILRARAETAVTETRADYAFLIFVPRIETTASYTRLSEIPDTPISFGGGPPVSSSTLFPQILDNGAFGLSAYIPLSDYLATLPSLYELGREGHVAQLAQAEATKERVSMSVAEAYFTLLTGRAMAQVADRSALAMTSRVEDLSRLQEAGEVTVADVMAVRAQAAAVKSQALQARGGARLGELRLKQLIGWQDEAELTLALDLFARPVAPEPGLAPALTIAAEQRAELRALESALKMQDAEAARHFGGMFPRVFVQGQLDIANPNQRIFPSQAEFRETWLLTVGLSWSPNDFLTERTRWLEADLGKDALLADLQALRDAFELEISSALSDWDVALENQQATSDRYQAATLAFSDRERLFELGEATVQDLLDAEQAARDAALGRITAATQLHLARLRYDRALGQLVEPRSKDNSGTP